MTRRLAIALVAILVLAGCAAAEPPATAPPRGGAVVTADDAVRAVLAHEPRLAGIETRDPELIGQASWYEVVPASGVGAFVVRVRVGWGDCPAGCLSEHTWQFAVAPDGIVTLLEERGDPVPPEAWPAS